MEPKHCETCQFFNGKKYREDQGGECLHPRFEWDKYGDMSIEDRILFHSYEQVYMYVGPKFGCIHHKEATNEN